MRLVVASLPFRDTGLLDAIAGFAQRLVRSRHMGTLLALTTVAMAVLVLPATASAQLLAAAVLPTSRSVQVNTPATAFATIINPGAITATGCGIIPMTAMPAVVSYQTTNPTTNEPTGTLNTPVDIPAGESQTFVLAITPFGPFGPTDVQFDFHCANTRSAAVITGVNTLLLSAWTAPVPDMVALAATPDNDGIVTVPPGGTGVFAVATVNVGTEAHIIASADTNGVVLPIRMLMCQTNPATGQCISAMVPSLARVMPAGSTFTLEILVTASDAVQFNPAVNRVFIRFEDTDAVTRGSTSVAVRTQ
jgi:hypothetical protein